MNIDVNGFGFRAFFVVTLSSLVGLIVYARKRIKWQEWAVVICLIAGLSWLIVRSTIHPNPSLMNRSATAETSHEPIRVPERLQLSPRDLALSPPPLYSPQVVSPKGSFRIVQTHDTDYLFRAEVIFKETGKRFLLEPSDITWAAGYCVSPDERWIFRSQKTGSGDNTAFVYTVKAGSVDTNGWNLGDAACTHYYATTSNTNGHYHTTTTFVRWIEPQGMVISLNGTSVDEVRALDVHHYILECDLAKQRFSKGRQLDPPNHDQVPAN